MQRAYSRITYPINVRNNVSYLHTIDDSYPKLARSGGRRCLVEIDPRYFRPTEVDFLLGDASKAKAKLGWEAQTEVQDLAREMFESDLAACRRAAA